VFGKWKKKCQLMGILIENMYVYSLSFAEDQVLLAQNHDDMEYMVRKLKEEYKKWELAINLEKKPNMCVWEKVKKF
jgi:hypothetical protein